MPLRIGFDMDGVLADLSSAYKELEARLFGPNEVEDEVPETPNGSGPGDDAEDEAKQKAAELKALRHKREIVWHAIETTENFWTTLKPLDAGAVPRLANLARRHRWDVFFLTQRPETAGESGQRQTQRWLVGQGFDLPSVIVVRGSRGKVAAALELDYLVDDTTKNCVDVKAESPSTRSILIIEKHDLPAEVNARWLGVAVARSVSGALDLLEEAQAVRSSPTLWEKLARSVGWQG
jgi:beta-phosphoglucomutase-like phosphatase (HAD superfamily)